jgi:hypothetical protein
MSVSPEHIHRLGLLERTRLGAEILTTYVQVRWLLHSQSPAEAVATLRRRARRHPIGPVIEHDRMVGWRLGHAVNVALRPLPTDVRCLFRSLTLLALMERRHMHPKLVIGERPQPFAAHAWIELDGQPLLREAEPDYGRLAEL